jgi:hypothetical protein
MHRSIRPSFHLIVIVVVFTVQILRDDEYMHIIHEGDVFFYGGSSPDSELGARVCIRRSCH